MHSRCGYRLRCQMYVCIEANVTGYSCIKLNDICRYVPLPPRALTWLESFQGGVLGLDFCHTPAMPGIQNWLGFRAGEVGRPPKEHDQGQLVQHLRAVSCSSIGQTEMASRSCIVSR